ncbi:hypothetical protein INT44_002383, partial [Umbelopsis vinacea]
DSSPDKRRYHDSGNRYRGHKRTDRFRRDVHSEHDAYRNSYPHRNRSKSPRSHPNTKYERRRKHAKRSPEKRSHRDRSYVSGSSGGSDDEGEQEFENEEEDREDYRKGGYHPIHIGDKFKDGQYTIIRKLGWGHFSTVWLVKDNSTDRHFALKVVKSAKHYTETALDEVKLLKTVAEKNPSAIGRQHVTGVYDDFMHNGTNGTHVCMTFEVLGENLLALIKRYKHRGIPIHLVKQIAKQMLYGLDYLHRECHIIHTDLKPENVLMCIDNAEELVRKSAARAAATIEPDRMGDHVKERPRYSDPERSRDGLSRGRSLHRHDRVQMIASQPLSSDTESRDSMDHRGRPHSTKGGRYKDQTVEVPYTLDVINIKIADLGNACWINHHFTEDIQTRQYRSPEVIFGATWGPEADIWSFACMVFELITGDYLFDPQKGARHNRDDDHLAQMIELIGDMPRSFALSGKRSQEYFNHRGELRHISRLRHWGLADVLHEKYSMRKEQAQDIASFLLPMLQYEHRASAQEMLDHEWLRL